MATPNTTTSVDAAGQDLRIEKMLDDHHVTWTFEAAFPLDHLDMKASLNNQARVSEPLDLETVERYTADYRRGDVFPALVARRSSPRAKAVVLVGGNHRASAALAAGIAAHPIYVITCEPETAQLLSYADNRLHGKPPSKLERLAQAAHLVESGHTNKAAAAMLGVTEPELSNYRKVAATSRHAREIGVGSEYDSLPQATRLHLAAVTSDPVFSEATKLVAVCQMTAPATGDLVKRLGKARSEEAQLTLLGSELEDRRAELQARAQRSTSRVAATGYSKASSAFTTLLGVDPGGVAGSTPPADISRMRRRLKEVVEQLVAIDTALKSAA